MILSRLLFLFTLYRLGLCSSCPSGCTCEENAVLCVNSDLAVIPNFENLLNSPTIIDLSGNKLNDIGPDDLSFEKSYMVMELYLNNSEIFDVSFEAFDELENLQELYMGENLLNSLPETFIQDLPNMLLLELSGNQFSMDMPVIRSTSLEVLSLANSKITNITVESLIYLPNLKMLLLQQNNIKYISPEIFDQLPTKIRFSLRIGYNPWECNCKTVELFSFLAKKSIIDTDVERYQCFSTTGSYHDIFHRNTMKLNYSVCGKRSLSRRRNSLIAEVDPGNYKESDKISQNQDKAYSLVKEDDLKEGESKNNSTGDQNVVACERQEKVILGVHLGTNEILIISTIFLIGAFVGFSFFRCLSNKKQRRLETTDSTTKLII